MRFKAKIDLWIKWVMLLCVVAPLPLIFTVPESEIWIMLVILIPLDALLLWILYGSHYELTPEYIRVVVGPFRQKIYFDKIKSYKEVKSWLSSMALTSDRIEIRVHNKSFITGTTHIGPEDKMRFMDELRRRCHNLEE